MGSSSGRQLRDRVRARHEAEVAAWEAENGRPWRDLRVNEMEVEDWTGRGWQTSAERSAAGLPPWRPSVVGEVVAYAPIGGTEAERMVGRRYFTLLTVDGVDHLAVVLGSGRIDRLEVA